MTAQHDNPLFKCYLKVHGLTFEQAVDQGLYKFPLWNNKQIELFHVEHPEHFTVGHLTGFEEYREWLEERVVRYSLLIKAVVDWPEFDTDEPFTRSSDLVEWFGQYRESCKELLGVSNGCR